MREIIVQENMQLKLDYNGAKVMQISNDAFFFITKEEEPLDEKNLQEAQKILAMFPNSFCIKDNWKMLKNGFIEATLIPYINDENDYDEYCDQYSNYVQAQIKWLNDNSIQLWLYNIKTKAREFYGEFKVYTNKYGLKYFCTESNKDSKFIPGKGSLHFLKNFSKRNT